MSDGSGVPPDGGGDSDAVAGPQTPKRPQRRRSAKAHADPTIERVQTRWQWILTLHPLRKGQENRKWVGIDPFIRMRGLLKRALRDYGFRCEQVKIRRKTVKRRKRSSQVVHAAA